MKPTLASTLLAFSVLLPAGSAIAGTAPEANPTVSREWNWFAGASAAYLFDYEEPMFSLSVGVSTPWSPFGLETDIYLEGGRIEDDNESQIPFGSSGEESDLQIVPATLNLRFRKPLGEHFGVYLGFGVGGAFTEIITDRVDRDQDVVFAGQITAGVSYYLGEHSELYIGGRWLYLRDTQNYALENDGAAEIGYRWHF